MNEGWIKLYRKSKDNPLMRDMTAWAIFCWILLTVDRKKGTMTLGRKWASEYFKIPESTFYSALKRLEKRYEVIKVSTAKVTTKFTIIEVKNWHLYQDINGPVNNPSTIQQQSSNTLQEVKNKELRNNAKALQKTAEYGNPDINFLLGYLKERLGLTILDDSEKTNRRYAYLCIKKFGVDKTQLAIDATAQSRFWHTKITSFKSLYYNAVQIVSSNRGEVKSLDATQMVSENERREGVLDLGEGVRGIEASVS